MLDTIWRDLRHGARMLAKNPGFAAVAMLSIAVGVGANAAMFSVADGLVLRPLPVTGPSRIVTIMALVRRHGFRNTALRIPSMSMSATSRAASTAVVAYTMVTHQLRRSGGNGHGAAQGRHGGERQPVRRDGRAAGGSAGASAPTRTAAVRSRSWCSITTSGRGASARDPDVDRTDHPHRRQPI